MPFGLLNDGATFQRAMDYAFKELIGKIIETYQDDLTVFSKERSSHVSHLKQVFERCRKYGISLNPAKSILGIDEGKLLGHIISKDGVKINVAKVDLGKKSVRVLITTSQQHRRKNREKSAKVGKH